MTKSNGTSITNNLNIKETDKFFSESIIPRVVTSAIRNSPKNQAEVASELSLNSNLITMFKQGRTKVPLARAKELATSLDIPVYEFVRLVISEYHPEMLEVIEDVFVVSRTPREAELFREARLTSGSS
ncbi:hypothetical protein KI655_18550 [Vibrio sp. D404a]|uniref:hypothetical protein n=1 Tax=unclassified Vibrio TaxID=2614977 RepID=UPI002554438D|nr:MULTISPECIES: hypothetical protein [unclassified Vibrio]MDK9739299.1 hypothetical protein [Vibrio sp. D404a]MDK9797665.1 hypothetical protein [Vibrio sp. D449a]